METLFLIGIVIYLIANSRSQSATRRRLDRLSKEVEDLQFALKEAAIRRERVEDDGEAGQTEPAAQGGLAIAAAAVTEPEASVKSEHGPTADLVAESVAVMAEPDAPYSRAPAEPVAAMEAQPETREIEDAETHPPVSAAPRQPKQSFEEWFAARGLVWLGGVTIALGGIFLIKLGIDYGLFTPTLQIATALVFALSLMVSGEWMRRREGLALAGSAATGVPIQIQNSNVREALVGAGLFIAFAAIFGAHMLLGLIDSGTAFAAFGALALLGLTMSVWHGIGVAYLGLAGGFITPLLVKSDAPDATALFVYLSALVGAICVTAQRRSWHELIIAALAGISGWALMWAFGAALQTGQITPPAMFLLFSMAACMLAAGTWVRKLERGGVPAGLSGENVMLIAATSCMALLFVAIVAIGGDVSTLPFAFAAIALLLGVAVVSERLSILAVAAAIWSGAYVLLWPNQTLPPHPGSFTSGLLAQIATLIGLAFAFAGFWRLQKTSKPVLWARVAGFTPVAIYVTSGAIATSLQYDFDWTAVGFGLSAAAAAACVWCLQRRSADGYLDAAGAFSWASAAAAVPALTLALSGPELTLAFAALLPVLAWTGVTWPVPAHRTIAIAVAVLVASRLVLGPGAWTALEGTHALGAWWIVLGLFAPSALSLGASRIFLRDRRDTTVEALEGLSLLLALSFAAYAIRIIMQGGAGAPSIGLAEVATHILVWGCGALALERVATHTTSLVAKGGFWILTGLFAAGVIVSLTPAVNPLFTPDSVGALPIVNELAYLYLVPAILMLVISWRLKRRGAGPLSAAFAVAGVGLIGVWLSLETRRSFHGPILSTPGFGDAEFYAYSVVWLLYSLALLALALWTKSAWLRWASLAVLSLTVAKVFGADMASLEGLWRVASFMGLGLSLVGIGALFQRFVFPRTGDAPSNND